MSHKTMHHKSFHSGFEEVSFSIEISASLQDIRVSARYRGEALP